MRPSFSSGLINEPFGDPGLYVSIAWGRRALLFDLGDTTPLSPTALLRVSDVFISHTHMDHFIGFDRLLRIALGRGRTLRLYGPPGLLENVAGKLRGYTWNLVDGYPLCIEAQEFGPTGSRRARFAAATGFQLEAQAVGPSPSSISSTPFLVLQEPMFSVRAVALDHRIPSLAYALEEQFHININKERLHAAGLPVGSWLKDVKRYLWEGKPDDFEFMATLYFEHRREERRLRLGEVRDLATITRGQKIVYVVDARFDEQNATKVVDLARGADLLYCEAPYLDRDAAKAADRYHLTARQAGELARRAGVRRLQVFHFSPSYTGQGEQLTQEAQAAFQEG